MVLKVEGFEGCFRMTIHTDQYHSLKLLKKTNENRKEIDVKIAKGTVTRHDMMEQFKFELKIFDVFLKTINRKKKENECCAVINKAISTVTKRINNMWNTIFLLFSINDECEPRILDVVNTFNNPSCTNCGSCNVTIESIINSIEIISIQENTIFCLSSCDFIEILQTTAFVDKTLMIKEVLQNEEIKGIVVTAPRKYGKSTNLTMLKYFLEIQVNPLGEPLTKANTEEPITDTSNYKLFKGLKISKEANMMDKHFGKYPVLYVNFKIEMNIKSYICVIQGCKEIIHKTYQLHSYLQISSKLSMTERQYCQLWCGNENYKMFKNADDISMGLKMLCLFLAKHYKKKCFVLIDEIDFFTNIVTITETLLEDYKLIVSFVKKLLLVLEKHKFMFKAFVTGKSGYAIHCIVPSYMKIQSFYKFHNFTDYYGLTENELEYLFKKIEFKNISITIKEVKAYYGPYHKIDELTYANKNIYCIWSILNVLKSKRIDNYWRDFGNFFCSFSNITIKDMMKKLLFYNDMLMVVEFNDYEIENRPITPHIIQTSETLDDNVNKYFFNTLLDLGYLTCSSTVMYIKKEGRVCYGHVKIPNQEVKDDIVNKTSLLS